MTAAGDARNEALIAAFGGHPVLADYALHFRARDALRARRPREALAVARELLTTQPDSVWRGESALLVGTLERAAGEPDAARAAFADARSVLPSGSNRWARATLSLAEVEASRGDAEAALDLAHELRRANPRGIGARRARRLVERIHRARPELAVDHVDEAELRLREGDPRGARDETEAALGPDLAPPLQARALWVRAQAEHALGLHAEAEATCLRLAHEADPLAARALTSAGTWRWNADDDSGALRLFRDVVHRFPSTPQAADALYAMGRIAQEEGRWEDARTAYVQVGERFPDADVAPEAMWRSAWVRWLAGDTRGAERAFARVAQQSRDSPRIAAEYWRARALERLGDEEQARARFAHVAEQHPASYYAGAAEERLGRRPRDGTAPAAPPVPGFPPDLSGPHADRARALAGLGFLRFARLELDSLATTDVSRRRLLDAYRAIGAVGPAIRLANALRPPIPGPLDEYLYPLGYWETVSPVARAHGLDPLLVASVIRQESLFEPEAVSSAGARGLMQLMPATARQITTARGQVPPPPAALHDVALNVDLGTTLMARLLARYDGSAVKALAAYNGGEDAVTKWERRYAGRDTDEFVELISFRETRDYVKAVLRNYRLYRQLYAAPSPSATSTGSPPKAPFDMITMTSPGRALETR